MNRKEQARLLVLNGVIARGMTAGQGAELLGVSLRHLRRLLAAYREEGAAALAHGNRGRKPRHALEQALRERVLELAQGRYAGLNHQHMSEELEGEGISVSRSTLRRILAEAGVGSPRGRRPRRHRRRRDRSPREGMLIQIDGSPHDWLEGRGPAMSLLAGVDDATGKIPFALFRPTEDAAGYFMLLRGIVARWGIPLALYHDRHQIFRSNTKRGPSLAEELSGKGDRPTHFGQLLEELAIASIAAHSPQAKGRIERLFGTLQDRLVAELRLAGAVSLEEANRVLWAYLEPFNRRFAVPARDGGLAYRAPEEGFRAEMVFCFKYERKVAPDNTVGFAGHRLQLLPQGDHGSYAGRTVQVQERMDGSVAVSYQGRIVGTRPAPAEALVLRTRKRGRPPEGVAPPGGTADQGRPGSAPVAAGAVGKWSGSAEAVHLSTARPSPSHPWRRYANKPGVTNSQDT